MTNLRDAIERLKRPELLQELHRLEARAEKAEARVKSRNNHIHRLLGEALENDRNLDGMKSRWQTAEAGNARLTKMVDWLANQLDCPSEFTNCAVDCAECRKEAARRAVAAGEETCQK